ncbi:hypothetical protein BDY19DRAFT_160376 [Irpex rosettiformis]|uniref:Uncharacterized protein n=1 Tax=Irpex rosettiformis TaxID=378272 RepID=A0ACB8U428_9APHY|nr:hypothetical protein BDY19DRAFT_160376 [Irpex rosettiformis]
MDSTPKSQSLSSSFLSAVLIIILIVIPVRAVSHPAICISLPNFTVHPRSRDSGLRCLYAYHIVASRCTSGNCAPRPLRRLISAHYHNREKGPYVF